MYTKLLLLLIGLFLFTGCSNSPEEEGYYKTFTIISGSENQDIEQNLMDFAKKQKIDLQIEYAGTLEIIDILNKDSTKYDAVWPSNSIWLNMLKEPTKIKYSRFISINPVVFGIRESLAKSLGFTNTDNKIYMKDIVQAVKDKSLNFVLPSVTQTNSGASAYLGFLTCLADKDGLGVLTEEEINKKQLKEDMVELFQGVARSSGDEGFANELFINGDYDAIVNYEASIINLNRELVSKGMEPLYLVYPYDGVSLSDSPFAYIDNGDEVKKEQFEQIQNYLLSEETENYLKETGRRTGYGGLIAKEDKEIFRSEWGIDTDRYLSPVHYPSISVIRSALKLYQDELKKPHYIVFCLDYSGSMEGKGKEALASAMDYILDYSKASEEFIQFSSRDQIVVVPFDSDIMDVFLAEKGDDTKELISKINQLQTRGGTDIYLPTMEALEFLDTIDPEEYARSVILMTDGESNEYRLDELEVVYRQMKDKIPVFSITFGDADESQLNEIAELTNGKVFNGVENLIGAFKTIRGYN